jgi:hypothetical protein
VGRFAYRHTLVVAGLLALLPTTVQVPWAKATGTDRLLPPSVTPVGTFEGVSYVRYDGIFEGATSTGAFRVPYQITAAADPDSGNRTVLVEPSHFVQGVGVRDLFLRPDVLFTRGFAHAGIGWSTASFGPGRDRRILDPTVPGVFINGGIEEFGGRTDHEIIVEFARALASDPTAVSMLGRAERRYVTGFSDSSYPVMNLVTSGLADHVFDLALPITTEWTDPQPAIGSGLFGGKVIIVNSEADESGNLLDRGVVPGHYRFYAVAGTPHAPDFVEVPIFTRESTPATYVPALRAHFLQGDRWVRTGTPPPPSYHLATSADGQVVRDGNGNAISVDADGSPVPRLPFVELGEARYITGFVGAYDNVRTIAGLGFGTHTAYRKAFRARLAEYVAAGYILPADAAAMRDRAGLCPPLMYTETYRDHYASFVAIESCTD